MKRTFAFVAACAVLTACNPPRSPAASRWNMSSPPRTSSAAAETLRMHANAGHALRFGYPAHFVERSADDAETMFIADDAQLPGQFSVRVRAVPLAEYRFENFFADTYRYDADRNAWFATKANEDFTPERATFGETTFYKFGMGDAGHFTEAYVVPHKKTGVMIEFGFEECLSCTEGEIPEQPEIDAMIRHTEEDVQRILESVRFEAGETR